MKNLSIAQKTMLEDIKKDILLARKIIKDGYAPNNQTLFSNNSRVENWDRIDIEFLNNYASGKQMLFIGIDKYTITTLEKYGYIELLSRCGADIYIKANAKALGI